MGTAMITVAAQQAIPFLLEKGMEKLKEHQATRKLDQGTIDVPEETWERTVDSGQAWMEPTGPDGMRGRTFTTMPDGQWVAAGDGRVSCSTGSESEVAEMVETAKAKGWPEVRLGGAPSFQKTAGDALKNAGVEVVTQSAIKAAMPALGMG